MSKIWICDSCKRTFDIYASKELTPISVDNCFHFDLCKPCLDKFYKTILLKDVEEDNDIHKDKIIYTTKDSKNKSLLEPVDVWPED